VASCPTEMTCSIIIGGRPATSTASSKGRSRGGLRARPPPKSSWGSNSKTRRHPASGGPQRRPPPPAGAPDEETYILEASAAKLGTEPNAHSLSRSNLANAGLRLDVLLRCPNQEVFQNVFFVWGASDRLQTLQWISR